MSESKIKNTASFSIDEILSSSSGELTSPENNFTELCTPSMNDSGQFRERALEITPTEDSRTSSNEGGAIFKTSSLKTGNQ